MASSRSVPRSESFRSQKRRLNNWSSDRVSHAWRALLEPAVLLAIAGFHRGLERLRSERACVKPREIEQLGVGELRPGDIANTREDRLDAAREPLLPVAQHV